MALTATLYNFSVQLADIDRGVYENFELRLACQPSETPAFMLTRLLAYCLEFQEGIAFTEGVASGDEPAVLVRDLTGRITAWIEVGAPDADRLHRGSKLAGRAALYAHRDTVNLLAQYAGKKIHRAAEIPVYSFGRGFIESATGAIQRRNQVSVSVNERQLYLGINDASFSTVIEQQAAGG